MYYTYIMKATFLLFLCCGASVLLYEDKEENNYEVGSGFHTEKKKDLQ